MPVACCAARPQDVRPSNASAATMLPDVVGFGVLLWFAVIFVFTDHSARLTYTLGFWLVDLLSVVLIVAAVRPSSVGWLRALLSSHPLVWLGRRSYSFYLW